MKDKQGISAWNIALLYVGTLMGAGFASGREVWQFFSVFGINGYAAILMVTILFITFGMMAVFISKLNDTTDIGKIIMPFKSPLLENFFGYVVATILFVVYIVMTAAGGALFEEQFGIHRAFGGGLFMLLVIATTLGGFERISKNFKHIVPVLLIVVFFICITIILGNFPTQGRTAAIRISPITPNWYFSAILYTSYNMLAGIPILANSAHRARSHKSALYGAALGGLILGLSAMIMNIAMLTDVGFSANRVLPILALSGKIGDWARWVCAILLLFASYASSSSNFYGFTMKIKEGKKKKLYIVIAAIIGFVLSLIGFADIITIVLPLEGYCGLIFLIAMTAHFLKLWYCRWKSKRQRIKNINNEDKRFHFPEGIKRVTGGIGGEAILVIGSSKTILIDCGMAFCADSLIKNIKTELIERPLDYVILSHTHYDHIGGLPYLRQTWPNLISFGAAYGALVLKKTSALSRIEALSRIAWGRYTNDKNHIVLMEGLQIDRVVGEADVISLGDKVIHIIETPGHTNCSLSLLLKPDMMFFPSETTGVYLGKGNLVPAMLKSYKATVASIEKCRSLSISSIVSPHYGLVPLCDTANYWDMSAASVDKCVKFIFERKNRGASVEEILEEYTQEFWVGKVAEEQMREAFILNARNLILNLLKEFNDEM